ncbi:MAG: right-handed parallel beta-helix repeat-containing protein, partial [Actinomycetota bacterium]|nr:right-handed parallel beta-helix repeat-containing protein [Actinomycetota bacterium]
MAAFLGRALNLPTGETDVFTDDNGSVFENDIDRLATAGITQGCNPPTNGRFCPNDPVTRGQMAAFLHRGLDPSPGPAGSVLYVDTDSLGGTCSDAREREAVSLATPWCSLGRAAEKVLPGDVVRARAGEYSTIQTCPSCNDNSVLQVLGSGLPGSWIRFEAMSGEAVHVTGAGGATHGIQIIETWDNTYRPRYVAIEGFEVSGLTGNCVKIADVSDISLSGLDISGCGTGAVELHSTTRATLENSRIHDNALAGFTSAVDLFQCGDGNVVSGNFIYSNTDVDSHESEGHGVTMDYCLAAGGAVIENNVIWENEGWCMAIYFSDGAVIRNNTCYMNGVGRADTGELSILGRDHAIHNNVLIPRDGRLALNIRERNPEYVGHLATIESDYNLMWSATHTDVVGWSFGTVGTVAEFAATNPVGWGTADLQVDPLLVDPGNDAFSLTAGSPAIDSGDGDHAPVVDITGNARPEDGDAVPGAVVDRGAYEYR